MNKEMSALGELVFDWPELKTMGIVVSVRQEQAVAKESEVTVRYSISSKDSGAKELLNATRSHWLVESMHWSLDHGLRMLFTHLFIRFRDKIFRNRLN